MYIRYIEDLFTMTLCAEWLSGRRSDSMTWTTQESGTIIYHQTDLQSPVSLSERQGQAIDGTVYYAMLLVRVALSTPCSVEIIVP